VRRPRLTALLVAAGLLTSAGVTSAAGSRPGGLHTDGQVLRDAQGRQVLLRGIAVIDKTAGRFPSFTPADARQVRSWGMNSIRLGLVWAGVEPRAGHVDQRYVDGIARIARVASDAGLYVVLDMHQDLYGVRWSDGAPEWATNNTCPHADLAGATGAWGTDYLSPQVLCSFTDFWTSASLQDHYAKAWQAVARAVSGNPRIAGFDLMNEPSQGLIPPGVFESQYLYPSQARWLAAIRRVDPRAVGFLEPPNYKYLEIPTAPPAIPANAAYGPHLYGPWDDVSQASQTRAFAEPTLAYEQLEAKQAGAPLWVGEWGVDWHLSGAVDFAAHVLDLLDKAKAGSAYWDWSPGGGYSPQDKDHRPTPMLAALMRAYPSATAGTLTSFSYDRVTHGLVVTWAPSPGATVVEVPTALYPRGLTVSGARRWSYDRAAGQLLLWGSGASTTATVTAR
jgi:endoglycosylceramidase